MRKTLLIAIAALAFGMPAAAQFDFRTTGARSARIWEITCTPTAAPAVSAAGMTKLFVPCTGIVGYTAGNTYISQNGGAWTLLSSFSSSGVTSVGLTVPSIMSVSGSPVTTSGTLAVSLASQTANLIWASPNGASGAPLFRAMVADDVPTGVIGQNQIATDGVGSLEIAADAVGAAEIAPDSVTLTTDTTGNYVASLTPGLGVAVGAAAEGGTPSVALDVSALLSGDHALGANEVKLGQSGIIFEGALANLFEAYVTVVDPTVDAIHTFPDRAGTVMQSGDTLTGDVAATFEADGSSVGTIQADSVALSTDTTGNYVASQTVNQGLLLTGTEGASLGLIDCAANQVLKRNAGDTAWECAADSTGGAPSFDTIAGGTNVTAAMVVGTGASLAASGSGTIVATSTTGNAATATALAADPADCAANTFATTIAASGALTCAGIVDADVPNTITVDLATVASDLTCTNCIGSTEVADLTLTTDTVGNYVATITAGTGLTGSGSTEGSTPTVAFDFSAALSGDHSLAANETKFGVNGLIFEGATANTFEGFITYVDPTADATHTWPDRSGTVMQSGDAVTGDVAITFEADGSTAATIQADAVALTTDTTGNYVATITAGVGISGASSVEGGTPTIALDATAALSGDHTLAANEARFGQSGLIFEGSIADLFEAYVSVTNPTADATHTLPDRAGTFMQSGDSLTGDVTVTFEADGSTAAVIPTGSVALSELASGTSANLAGVVSDETGTGSLVFSVAPTLTGTATVEHLSATGQYYTATNTATTGATTTLDWNTGNVQYVSLTQNTTIAFSNPQSGSRYVIMFKQDATGGRTVTWPATVSWPGGTIPTITAAANAFDMVACVYDGTNTKYRCVVNANFS